MRKLLNTLYITSTGRYLSLDGENIVILEDQKEIGRIPLHNIEQIVTFGYTGSSPALMYACAKKNIGLSFMSGSGKFLARISGEVKGNVILRKQQYRMSENKKDSICIARNIILGKVYNARGVLERAIRDYPMRIDVDKFKNKSSILYDRLKDIRNCNNSNVLLGLEGEAASVYFSVFDDLILQQKEVFYFHGRNRRPPLDNVNAMLSFAYSLLVGMCTSALETVGLDPYVGFYHTDKSGRVSLALDMMEELRSVFADRFVLTIINKRIIDDKGFIKKENGAVVMSDDTRKEFLKYWQNKKQETITHPFLGEKIEWGLVPYTQAMLLARYIRGDLDEYPTFLWK